MGVDLQCKGGVVWFTLEIRDRSIKGPGFMTFFVVQEGSEKD